MSTMSTATTMEDTDAAMRLLIVYVLPVVATSWLFCAAPERRISIKIENMIYFFFFLFVYVPVKL